MVARFWYSSLLYNAFGDHFIGRFAGAIMLMRRARAANQAALACPSLADRFDAPEMQGTCARNFHLWG